MQNVIYYEVFGDIMVLLYYVFYSDIPLIWACQFLGMVLSDHTVYTILLCMVLSDHTVYNILI